MRSFSRKSNFKRHVASVHTEKHKFQCPFCDKACTRRDELVQYHIVDKFREVSGSTKETGINPGNYRQEGPPAGEEEKKGTE